MSEKGVKNNKGSITEVEQADSLAKIMQAYIAGNTILSEKDDILLYRLLYADEQIKAEGLAERGKAAKNLAVKFSVSLATAYRTLKNAEELFNTIDIVDSQTFARVLLHQSELLQKRAEAAEDYKAAAKLQYLKKDIFCDLIQNKPLDFRSTQKNNYYFNIGDSFDKNTEPINIKDIIKKVKKWKLSKEQTQKLIDDIDFKNVDDGK